MALFAAPSYGCSTAHASDIYPSDYCFQTDIAITYAGGGTVTNQPVRVQINADGLIDSGQLDPRAWDVKPILGSLANEVHLTAQSLGSTTSPWWIVVPEISAGDTRTHRLYSGSAEQRRDQGIFFTSNDEYLTTPDTAVLDLTTQFVVYLQMNILDDTPRDQVIVDKHVSSTGYEIALADVSSVLNLRFTVDGVNCDYPINSAYIGDTFEFTFYYRSAAGTDATIGSDPVALKECDTDAGAIAGNSSDLVVGADETLAAGFLSGVIIDRLAIFDNTGKTFLTDWQFDAKSMEETVSTNPFEGTTEDYGPSGLQMAYVFDRDQSDFTYTVGATQLVSGAEQITLPDSNPDVLGPAFGIDPSSTPSEVTTGALYTVFLDKWARASPVRSFGYAAILSFIGLMMAVGAYKLTRYIPISLFMFGMPLAIGVGNGWITPWWMILWVIVAIGGWFAQRYTETA